MDTNTPTINEQEATILSWTAPERPIHGRTAGWYLAAGAIVVGFSVYAILAKTWSFLLVLTALALTYGIKHSNRHLMHTVDIREGGIMWDKTLIPWTQCIGYWMLQGPDYIELHIETNIPGNKHLVVQTGPLPPQQISAVLSQLTTPLHDRKEGVLDTLIRICKL